MSEINRTVTATMPAEMVRTFLGPESPLDEFTLARMAKIRTEHLVCYDELAAQIDASYASDEGVMQIFNRNMLTIKLSPDLVELHKKIDELLSSVHARILAGETIEQIYASIGLEYAPYRLRIAGAGLNALD